MKRIVVVCASLLAASLLAASSLVAQVDEKAPFPVDPAIRKGKLENGLTYYIKQNKQPEKRVELRLAVNAGSMQETDNQQGLAHFCEHMLFNGTKKFPKQDLVNFLEKMGIEFGAELNAYTSFDETVYKLSVPSDRFGLVDTAILVLNEWSQNALFDNTEIDKERGVILSELRQGLGAEDRMRKKYWPVILKDSRYALRFPIGKKELLETFPHDTLKQFYKDWYRPNLMAVSIAGDVNVDSVEHLVKKYFSTNVNPANEKKHVEYPVPGNSQPLVSVVTDKEYPYSLVWIENKMPRKPQLLVGDYKNSIVRMLFNNMLNSRLAEVEQKPDAPFLQAGSEFGEFIGRTTDAFSGMALAKENKVKESVSKLVEINRQLKQFGFTQGELDRQKKEIISFYEKAVKEKDKTPSGSYAEEYIRNFLENEPIPGIENEYAYVKQMLQSIQLQEMNNLATQCISDSNLVIVVMLPEKAGIAVPTGQEILDAYGAASKTAVTSYVDKYVDKPLTKADPKPAKISKRTDNKEFGYTEVVLSNGAKIVMKPNNWKNDEILFMALSPGGQAKCKAGEIFTSRVVSDLVNQSGLGDFNNIDLNKKLSGNTASLHTFISLDNEGLNGSTAPKDLQTLLQLNYLYFNAPAIDTAVFDKYITEQVSQLRLQMMNPRAFYSDSVMNFIYNHDKRFTLLTDTNDFLALNREKCLAFYKDRITNASDFTFYFVGNFTVDSLLPLVQKWIGGIASTKTVEKVELDKPFFPAGKNTLVIKKGLEPQALVKIISKSPIAWDRKQMIDLKILCEILDIRLRETMREDQGRVYGAQVSQAVKKWKTPECTVQVGFVCAPEAVDTLLITAYSEIEKLRNDGPPQVDVDKEKEILTRKLETDVKTNGYWKSVLESKYSDGFEIEPYETQLTRIKSVTADDIKAAANLYLKMINTTEAILVPGADK